MFVPRCFACRDTGWVSFVKVVNGKTLPWQGACECAKGAFLKSDREGTAQIPNPVRVAPAPREAYHAAIERNREQYRTPAFA